MFTVRHWTHPSRQFSDVVNTNLLILCSIIVGDPFANSDRRLLFMVPRWLAGYWQLFNATNWPELFCINLNPISIWCVLEQILRLAIENILAPNHLTKIGRALAWKALPLEKSTAAIPVTLSPPIPTKRLKPDAVIFFKEFDVLHEREVIWSCNLGKFYKHVNDKLSIRCRISSPLGESRNLVVDDAAKANILNDYFCSGGVYDDGSSVFRAVPFLTASTSTSRNKLF